MALFRRCRGARIETFRHRAQEQASGIRHTYALTLDKINDAFDLMHEGKSIRSVVVY